MRAIVFLVLLTVLALVAGAVPAQADPITTACKNGPSTPTCFRPSVVIDPPNNGAPLPALFAEVLNVGGAITYSIQASAALDPGEFIRAVAINLDPLITPSALTFTLDAIQSTQTLVTITKTTQNAQNLSPEQAFDILFDFPTSGAGGGVQRFTAGELIEWTVTCNAAVDPDCTGFGVNSFNFFNADPQDPNFRICAHVQGLGVNNGLSNKICGGAPGGEQVPEPATLTVLGVGLVGLAMARRLTSPPRTVYLAAGGDHHGPPARHALRLAQALRERRRRGRQRRPAQLRLF